MSDTMSDRGKDYKRYEFNTTQLLKFKNAKRGVSIRIPRPLTREAVDNLHVMVGEIETMLSEQIEEEIRE